VRVALYLREAGAVSPCKWSFSIEIYIITDGMENASREYSYDQIKRMIDRQKEKYGWEFIFLGANIDAIETAKRFGIAEEMAANYHADREGTQLNYEAVNMAFSMVRNSGAVDKNWKAKIDKDYNARKRK